MRYWAYLVDLIIVFRINGIVLGPFKFYNEGVPIDIGLWTMNSVVAGIVYYAYFLLMTKFLQQTVGKMIFGLKVVKENSEGQLLWSDLLFREIIGRFLYN